MLVSLICIPTGRYTTISFASNAGKIVCPGEGFIHFEVRPARRVFVVFDKADFACGKGARGDGGGKKGVVVEETPHAHGASRDVIRELARFVIYIWKLFLDQFRAAKCGDGKVCPIPLDSAENVRRFLDAREFGNKGFFEDVSLPKGAFGQVRKRLFVVNEVSPDGNALARTGRVDGKLVKKVLLEISDCEVSGAGKLFHM